MAHEYVRVCPVCETENAPALVRCRCGASLSGIDFSLKKPPPDASPQASPEIAPATASEPLPDTAPLTLTPPLAGSHGLSPLRGARETLTAQETSAEATGDSPAAPEVGTTCPYPDCAQPNPPGELRCVYCNRPLSAALAVPQDATLLARDAVAGSRRLPAALREHYRVIDVFPVSGSEADIMLAEELGTGERRVVKLYRQGLEPDFRLLDILSKTVGDVVVHVLECGVSEGVAYELLEYIPNGTLAELMESGPLPVDDARRMVAEIADALNGIHAHHILHRDLKPENVLLRSRSPLELALTDFGIASLSEATQRFTSVARTTKYAAPEALTGVLDEKSDWWSLGMIALEAATGRHPFDGLTEHVMNHHLATRPIDVRSIYDDDLRLLCRGLLLRDPKRRWGAAEVTRWLAHDAGLEVPDDAQGGASAVQPYRIGATDSSTAAELALALAKHWDAARKDLARGQIGNWLEHELHDYNLARKLFDIREHRDLSDDVRLLRFLLSAAPDLPPVWLGLPVSGDAILAAARRAANEDRAAEAWLDSLSRERVLTQFESDPELRRIDERWRESWAYFLELWNAARAGEAAWRKKPRPVAGLAAAEVVSYDDVMYGAPLRLNPPPQRTVNAALLIAQTDAGYVAALRGEVTAALADITGYCPWFESLWDKAQQDAVGMLVMHRLLVHARDDAIKEKNRQGVSDEARARIVAEARSELVAQIEALLDLAPGEALQLDADTVSGLLDALGPFQKVCQRAVALGYTQPECVALRTSAEKFSAMGLTLHRALSDCGQAEGTNAIFVQPQRLLIPLFVVALIAARAPWVGLAMLVAGLIFGAYRAHVTFRARDTARSRWRQFRGNAQAFIRLNATEGNQGFPP